MSHRLYIAEDDAVMASLLTELAREAGFSVVCFSNGRDVVAALRAEAADALLADLQMPEMSGIELLEAVNQDYPGLLTAMITGFATVPDVQRAFRAGAMDLITKPFDNQDVRHVLKRMARQLDRERRIDALTERLSLLEQDVVVPIVESRAMKETMSLVRSVADLDTPVLLIGETGTGKGVLAGTIHASSQRHKGPWFSVNCGSLADSVAESELFGHERGAFTGATSRKRGLLELANGGTLFLDEINSASPAVQTRLLDFVQDRRLRRVGGEQPIEVDVRLVVASNQDLQQLVEEGAFREDLWYRLNVFPIPLPALRERREDILPLAEGMILRLAKELNRPVTRLDHQAETLLLQYHWPGNVRQLENALHRAVVLATSNEIQARHLPAEVSGTDSASLQGIDWSLDSSLQEVEARWVQHMLKRCNGNKSEAARRLGIDVSTLHRKLRGLNP